MSFAGKAAIVTGAAGGVGLEVVRMLAEQGAGVVGVDIDPAVADLGGRFGAQAEGLAGDGTRAETAAAAVELALRRWGRVDVLVSNAGYIVPKSILDISEAEWDQVMNVNVKSMFFFCRQVIPEMIRQGGGAIVATASISSVVGLGAQSAYCASKGAVLQLTRQLAVEYAPHKIRVNAVGPGAIDTPFLTRYLIAQPDPDKAAREVQQAHPLGRWATATEVASSIVYLASDAAAFITGAMLMVDGGYTAR